MGSVRQLTNSAGATTDTYEYDAFGNELNKTGTTPNNYLYRGEEWDPDLGLYYLRARYYNPLTGRFLSRDPEEGKIGYPKTLHKYSFAAGDPVNGSDPTGKDDEIEYQFIFSSVEKGPLLPGFAAAGITGTKIVAAGTALAVLARFVGSAFNLISEALDLSLGPDLHDPGKPEPGNPNEPEPTPISSGP
jgi:RHS repeat-associated protein